MNEKSKSVDKVKMSELEKQTKTLAQWEHEADIVERNYDLKRITIEEYQALFNRQLVPLKVALAEIQKITEKWEKHYDKTKDVLGQKIIYLEGKIQKLQDSKLALSLTQIEHIAKLEGQIAEANSLRETIAKILNELDAISKHERKIYYVVDGKETTKEKTVYKQVEAFDARIIDLTVQRLREVPKK